MLLEFVDKVGYSDTLIGYLTTPEALFLHLYYLDDSCLMKLGRALEVHTVLGAQSFLDISQRKSLTEIKFPHQVLIVNKRFSRALFAYKSLSGAMFSHRKLSRVLFSHMRLSGVSSFCWTILPYPPRPESKSVLYSSLTCVISSNIL